MLHYFYRSRVDLKPFTNFTMLPPRTHKIHTKNTKIQMSKLGEYKDKFSYDYRKAIKEFNDGEFQSAQRDLRPGIEKLCKLVMYDMANDEGEVD